MDVGKKVKLGQKEKERYHGLRSAFVVLKRSAELRSTDFLMTIVGSFIVEHCLLIILSPALLLSALLPIACNPNITRRRRRRRNMSQRDTNTIAAAAAVKRKEEKGIESWRKTLPAEN